MVRLSIRQSEDRRVAGSRLGWSLYCGVVLKTFFLKYDRASVLNSGLTLSTSVAYLLVFTL